MKRSAFLIVILFAVLIVSVTAQQEVLTNDSIIRLVQAGTTEAVLLNLIHVQPSRFDLGTKQILDLKAAGATDRVILAMLDQTSGKESAPPAAAELKSEQNGRRTIPADTEVRLETTEKITSETAHMNDIVHFRVFEEVRIDGMLAIPKGASAEGRVTYVEPKGRMGVPGNLAVSLTRLRLGARDVPIRGVLGGHTNVSLGTAALVGMGGVFKKGKSTVFPEGTQVKALVAE